MNREDRSPEFSLFVGDLNSDIEEDDLLVKYLFHYTNPILTSNQKTNILLKKKALIP
jgi:hypothetical protein